MHVLELCKEELLQCFVAELCFLHKKPTSTARCYGLTAS